MVRWQLLHVAAYFGHADAVKVPCLQPNHSPECDPEGSCPGQALVERGAKIEAFAVLWMLVAFHFGISDHKTLAHIYIQSGPCWSYSK